MAVVFEKPKSLANVPLHYCPGCPHGIIHRLVAEAIDELGIEGIAIGVISYVVINLVAGKSKKITPLMYILAILFVLKYIFQI